MLPNIDTFIECLNEYNFLRYLINGKHIFGVIFHIIIHGILILLLLVEPSEELGRKNN